MHIGRARLFWWCTWRLQQLAPIRLLLAFGCSGFRCYSSSADGPYMMSELLPVSTFLSKICSNESVVVNVGIGWPPSISNSEVVSVMGAGRDIGHIYGQFSERHRLLVRHKHCLVCRDPFQHFPRLRGLVKIFAEHDVNDAHQKALVGFKSVT